MVISIEAIKKPEGANKAQELKAMEEALKKATEEAHKQRIEITGEKEQDTSSLTQAASTSKTGL
jgi:benzoyl-CoA reductase/2-hydroxyglutaryl-CoA dehydratase subunit BcrC/BadD/HgdB